MIQSFPLSFQVVMAADLRNDRDRHHSRHHRPSQSRPAVHSLQLGASVPTAATLRLLHHLSGILADTVLHQGGGRWRGGVHDDDALLFAVPRGIPH